MCIRDRYYVYQKINSACEFFLRYRNSPKRLIEEAELNCDDKQAAEAYINAIDFLQDSKYKLMALIEYNEWLFKLVFKDVLYTKTVGGEY